MQDAVERRITLFADHPDPTRHLWVGFVEIMVRLADGQQAIEVHALDDNYLTREAAQAAAEAWVAEYKAAVDGNGPPFDVVRL